VNEAKLVGLLKNQDVGLTLKELWAGLSSDFPSQQALLRLLRRMEAAGQIRFEGNTRARRYRLRSSESAANVSSITVTEPVESVSISVSHVPLAPESRDVLQLLETPFAQRVPVSYRREFLDEYLVGHTQYLPESLRRHLAEMGRTADEHQQAGTYARKVLERLLVDLSWNSSRLEGNTYSLLDTQRLLESGKAADGKSAVEAQMLLNHKAAIELLVGGDPGGPARLDERTLKTLHALLLENLVGNPLDEGRLRSTPVAIAGSAYLPLANPQLIDECFRQLVLTAQQIADPFERSFFLLVHLPYLQPFIDGNKRVARLAANISLIEQNLAPLSFVDVPVDLYRSATLAVYEFNRIEPLRDVYIWAYRRSAARLGQVRTSLGEPDVFRIEHRAALRQAVAEVVLALLPRSAWRQALEVFAAKHMLDSVAPRFIAAAELDLEHLNEVTSARYKLRPSEYNAWAAIRGDTP
jgi:fido (protein-threonine AMPylation protein)